MIVVADIWISTCIEEKLDDIKVAAANGKLSKERCQEIALVYTRKVTYQQRCLTKAHGSVSYAPRFINQTLSYNFNVSTLASCHEFVIYRDPILNSHIAGGNGNTELLD